MASGKWWLGPTYSGAQVREARQRYQGAYTSLSALGPVARSLVSAIRWLRDIKTYRFPWYLMQVSANRASSNPGQSAIAARSAARHFVMTSRMSASTDCWGKGGEAGHSLGTGVFGQFSLAGNRRGSGNPRFSGGKSD